MSEPLLIDQQRKLLRGLLQLGRERAIRERTLEQQFQSGTSAAQADYARHRKAIDQRVAAEIAEADRTWEQAQQEIKTRFEAEKQAIAAEFTVFVEMATTQYQTEREAARAGAQESRWMAAADLDGGKSVAREQLR